MTKELEKKILPPKLSTLKDRGGLCKYPSSVPATVELKGTETTSLPIGVRPKLISSVFGKLDTIVLFFPTNEAFNIYPYKQFLEELIHKLIGSNRLFLLVLEAAHLLCPEVEEALVYCAEQNGNRFKTIVINTIGNLNPWSRDVMVSVSYILENQEYIYLIEPKNSFRNNSIPRHLVKHLNKLNQTPNLEFRHLKSPIEFEGGNVLKGDNFILIGAFKSNRINLKKWGGQYLGENIIFLESRPIADFKTWTHCKMTADNYCNRYEANRKNQAIFHLDLFITLAGKLGEKEVILVADPVIGFILHDGMRDDVKTLVQSIIMNTTKAINELVFSLKQQLSDAGILFEIKRNPLPLTFYDETKDGKKVRNWAWASYNNALVEIFYDDNLLAPSMVRNVVLPSYGISSDYSDNEIDQHTGYPYGTWTELHKYDLKNQWIWKDLGFQTIVLRNDFNPFSKKAGSLNCLTNCIKRG